MTYRLSDGGDKIVAFERGISDERAHMAFETPGVTSVIVDETYLVAYSVDTRLITELVRMKLYDNEGTLSGVQSHLRGEQWRFRCAMVLHLQ